jgi:hypothetical protein
MDLNAGYWERLVGRTVGAAGSATCEQARMFFR